MLNFPVILSKGNRVKNLQTFDGSDVLLRAQIKASKTMCLLDFVNQWVSGVGFIKS